MNSKFNKLNYLNAVFVFALTVIRKRHLCDGQNLTYFGLLDQSDFKKCKNQILCMQHFKNCFAN